MSRRDPVLLLVGIALGFGAVSLWHRIPQHRNIDWDTVRQAGVASPDGRREEWSDHGLGDLVNHLDDLVRVTPRAVPEMPNLIDSRYCRIPTTVYPPPPHNASAIHVYVTPDGEAPLLARSQTYPAGTVVLKQKLTQQGDTELFTGMFKHEAGYNPDCGDWEFFVLSGHGSLLARGNIESCIDCHRDYADRGYLSLAWQTDSPSNTRR